MPRACHLIPGDAPWELDDTPLVRMAKQAVLTHRPELLCLDYAFLLIDEHPTEVRGFTWFPAFRLGLWWLPERL